MSWPQWKNYDQQYIQGLTWNGIWLLVNISTTILNKSIFAHFKFPYPVTVSMVHMICTCLLSRIYIWYGEVPTRQLNTNQQLSVAAFSLLFCMNIALGNVGIFFTSVATSQVIRATTPGITMALSFLLLGKRYTFRHMYAILFVATGVSTAAYGDLEYTLIGIVVQLIGCIMSSCKSITASQFLVGELKFHPIELSYRMSLYAALQMFAMSFWFGELGQIHENQALSDSRLVGVLLINGLMAFLLNFSNFMFTRLTSPLTVNVSGSLKNVLTIIISILIFHTPVSLINGIGIITTVIATTFYNYVDYRSRYPSKSSSPTGTQDSSPVLPTKLKESIQ